MKNSRQSDTILENSPKGDSQSNGAAENALREAEGMIRTWKLSVEEKMKAVIDKKRVRFARQYRYSTKVSPDVALLRLSSPSVAS